MDNHSPLVPHSPHRGSLEIAGAGPSAVGSPAYRGLAPRPRREDDDDAVFTAGFLWKALSHCWKWAAPLAVVLAAASLSAIWWCFEPVYQAAAWIQVEEKAPYLAYASPQERPEHQEQFVKTQVELLRGPLVVAPVVGRPDIAKLPEVRAEANPLAWMRKRIEVDAVGQSALYTISFRSKDAEGSAQIVNALVDEYFGLRDEKEVARMQRVITLLEEETRRRGARLQDLRQKVRDLNEALVGKDPFTGNATNEAGLRDRPLESLRERLTEAEVEMKVVEVEAKAIEEEVARGVTVPDTLIEMALNDSTEIQDARAQIAAKREMLRQVEATAARGRADPSYLRLEREMQQYQQILQQELAAKRPEIEKRLALMADLERQDEFRKVQTKLENARLVYDMLQQQYEEEVKRIEQSGGQSLELEFARGELAREERFFDMIAERATALRTELRAPGRVTLLQRAAAPEAPVEQFPLKPFALALLASFALPFGLGILRERMIRRISEPEQLEEQTHVHIVAEVAQLPGRTDSRRRRAIRSRSKTTLFEESIDSLRTCLILADASDGGTVVAVTSAVGGEGKTSVASQLAVSLARASGQRVLLIDGDMRAPDVHHLFQIPKAPGLAELLEGKCSQEEAIVREWTENLDLLPAGVLHKTPHELLGNHAFETTLQQLASLYAYVIIDTPPVLSASEALVMAKAADSTLVCAMRGRSREGQTRLAYERLTVAGARTVGAVLNAVPVRRYAGTYGSYGYACDP